ncbi:hypothetical protein EWM64_g3688 [Hericium alpestre]|uniref:FAD-binding domain-containing protein n=1 Tax=Hericium alpestre TaxID=135208 RepID=A0A4Z0A1J6_9AGAM|nr:hypothetical protein EWM64_g3688 [Hericium alpestre]
MVVSLAQNPGGIVQRTSTKESFATNCVLNPKGSLAPMSTHALDVLVVGAGPTGLVTALPRTLEIYKFLGVLDEMKGPGMPMPDLLQYVDSKPGKAVPVQLCQEESPAYPERIPWLLGQDTACRVLLKHLRGFGIEVEMSTELYHFEQREDHVTASIIKAKNGIQFEKVNAKYLVGADGGKGFVRKSLGLSFVGETQDDTHVLVGEVQAYGIDNEHWHKFGGAPQDSIMLRPTDRSDSEHVFFLSCTGPNFDLKKGREDHNYLRKFVYDVAGFPDLRLGEIEAITDYRLNIRTVRNVRNSRVFIAGDAAYVHSVTGGQGMNSSVMDALEDSLASKGSASDNLLETYTIERLPVIEEMLERTTTILEKTFKAVSVWPSPVHLDQLGVNYRWSPIVIGDGVENLHVIAEESGGMDTGSSYIIDRGEALRPGDRAHDAYGLLDLKTGAIKRLFDIFGVEHHTILFFVDGHMDFSSFVPSLGRIPRELIQTVVLHRSGASISDLDNSTDFVLYDSGGHAHAAYRPEASSRSIVIIRPDGVVGALLGDMEGVNKYFSGVLSPTFQLT